MYNKAINKKILCPYLFLLLPCLNVLATVGVHNLPGIYLADKPNEHLSEDEMAKIELVTAADDDMYLDDTLLHELIVVTFRKQEGGRIPYLSQMPAEAVYASEALRGKHAAVAILSTHTHIARSGGRKEIIVLSLLFPLDTQQRESKIVNVADAFNHPRPPAVIFPSYVYENLVVSKELASQLIKKGEQGFISQNMGEATTLVDLRSEPHNEFTALAVDGGTPYLPNALALESPDTYPIILLSGEKKQSGTVCSALQSWRDLEERSVRSQSATITGEGAPYSNVVLAPSPSPSPSSGYSSPHPAGRNLLYENNNFLSSLPIDIKRDRPPHDGRRNYQIPPPARALNSSYSQSPGSYSSSSLGQIREDFPLEHSTSVVIDSAVSSLTDAASRMTLNRPGQVVENAATGNAGDTYMIVGRAEDGTLRFMDDEDLEQALSLSPISMPKGRVNRGSNISSPVRTPYPFLKKSASDSTQSAPAVVVSHSSSPMMQPIEQRKRSGTSGDSRLSGKNTLSTYALHATNDSQEYVVVAGGPLDPKARSRTIASSAVTINRPSEPRTVSPLSRNGEREKKYYRQGGTYSRSAPDVIVSAGSRVQSYNTSIDDWIGVPPPYIAQPRVVNQQLLDEFSSTAPLFSDEEYKCTDGTCAGEFARRMLLGFLNEKKASLGRQTVDTGVGANTDIETEKNIKINEWLDKTIMIVSNEKIMKWDDKPLQGFIRNQLKLMKYCRSLNELKTILYGVYSLAFDHFESICQQVTYAERSNERSTAVQVMAALAEEAQRVSAGFDQKDPVLMNSGLAPNDYEKQLSLKRFAIRWEHVKQYRGEIFDKELGPLPGVDRAEDGRTTAIKITSFMNPAMPWLFISDCLQSVDSFHSLLKRIPGIQEHVGLRRERKRINPLSDSYVSEFTDLLILARLLKYNLTLASAPAVNALLKQAVVRVTTQSGKAYLSIPPGFKEFIDVFMGNSEEEIQADELKVLRAIGKTAIENALTTLRLSKEFSAKPVDNELAEDHQLHIDMARRILLEATKNKWFIDQHFDGLPPSQLITDYLLGKLKTVSGYTLNSFTLHKKTKPAVIKSCGNKNKAQIVEEFESAVLGSEALLWTKMRSTVNSTSRLK